MKNLYSKFILNICYPITNLQYLLFEFPHTGNFPGVFLQESFWDMHLLLQAKGYTPFQMSPDYQYTLKLGYIFYIYPLLNTLAFDISFSLPVGFGTLTR